MKRRIRVERVVTDQGYGNGWVVLGAQGGELGRRSTWSEAFELARWLVRVMAQYA